MRVIVIGAGPMGIAAAIGAADRGHEVTVLERGTVGASLRTWGPTRFFSPLRMNVTPRMWELLRSARLLAAGQPAPGGRPATRQAGAPLDGDALLTGPEYADHVLLPLTQSEPLRGRVRTALNVIAVGRRGLTRTDYAGHPLRAERPFRILCDDVHQQTEETFEADAVLDASGGLVVPRPIGAGGLPARGESRLTRRPIRTLGALADADLSGKRVLVLGDGHSAANAIGFLEQRGDVNVIWAVRSPNRRPCEEVPNDPLPERRSVVERANALAEAPPPFLRVERRAMIESVAQNNGHAEVALTGGRVVQADVIAAFTGYRPDGAFLSELAVEISPVTEGGARLYRAISNVTDCLSVPAVKREDLQTGEERFFFVGSRGYGRARSFLLQTGFAQLEVLLDGLS